MRISTKGSLKALASASGSFLLSAFHIQLGEIEGTSVRKREPGEDFSYLDDLSYVAVSCDLDKFRCCPG